MTTLFDPAARDAIVVRLRALRADSPRGWGKMTPAQALAHCTIALESATGDTPMRQLFIGKLFAPFVRKGMLGPKPFPRNSPTGPTLIVSDTRDLAVERDRLIATIGKFVAAGPAAAAKYEHGFLGRLSGDEWGRTMHKHIDHHLVQFGV